MTTTDRVAAEQRGRSAAVVPQLAAAASGGMSAAATLTDVQRTYLDRLLVNARAAAEQRSALDERVATRNVRATVAIHLADALAAGDERTVATFLPVYAVAADLEDASRPAALLRAV